MQTMRPVDRRNWFSVAQTAHYDYCKSLDREAVKQFEMQVEKRRVLNDLRH